MITYETVHKLITEMELNDETLQKLQEAAEYYCSNYDIALGFKTALLTTLQDQYENHAGEQAPDDLDKLLPFLV